MKPWKKLGQAKTPDGKELVFSERDGEFALRVGGVELMTTRQRASEEKLAELGCDGLDKVPAARVLIGGLGFGFTLRASLSRVAHDAKIVVAELIPKIVTWNRDPQYPLGADAMADRRVQVEIGDVSNFIARADAAYDAILLDVDNGPEALTFDDNKHLYNASGLARVARALRPGGRLAVWSVEESPGFINRLERAGFTTETHHSHAHNGGGGQRWIYVARRAQAGYARREPAARGR